MTKSSTGERPKKIPMQIYVLWHSYRDEEGRDTEMHLGVYSSRKNAEESLAFLRTKPGFRDHPNGFEIKEGILDRTYITEPFGSPLADAS